MNVTRVLYFRFTIRNPRSVPPHPQLTTMATAATNAPLWTTMDAVLMDTDRLPTVQFSLLTNVSNRYRSNVLHRLVSAHPLQPSSTVTTLIERHEERLRVAVYNGLETNDAYLHSSFQLPPDACPLALCWANFGGHEHLCVLVDATTVSLWDVYSLSSAENSSTVTLPFECCAMHAIDQGLLLQRQADAEDRASDAFVLQAPSSVPQGWAPVEAHSTSVASLFSLQHPLEDVLPVCEVQPHGILDASTPHPITDAFEQVLWVGTAKWAKQSASYTDRCYDEQVLAVTYHALTGRHAVWTVGKAPPPPSTPPLYQRTRQPVSSMDVFPEIDDFVASAAPAPRSSTRDEALADALGVRRTTPRKSMERSRPSLGGNAVTATDHHASFFSPRAEELLPLADTSIFGFSGGPSVIHASVAMQCLYKQQDTSPRASQIFLVSNDNASGDLVLCLVVPDESQHLQQVWFWELRPQAAGAKLKVEPRQTLTCRAAQPMQVCPTPAVYWPHPRHGRSLLSATDLLVLSLDGDLRLCRVDTPFVQCPVGLAVQDLVDATGGQVTLVVKGANQLMRASLSLQSSCPLVNRAMATIDAALVARSSTLLSLWLIASVCSAEQACVMDVDTEAGWTAFYSVLLSFVRSQLLISSSLTPSSNQESRSAWEKLLDSEVHHQFAALEERDLILKHVETVQRHLHEDIEVSCEMPVPKGIVPLVFDSLHLFYEESKLQAPCARLELSRMGSLLMDILGLVGGDWVPAFSKYYQVDLGDALAPSCTLSAAAFVSREAVSSFAKPPSFFEWTNQLIKGTRLQLWFDQVGIDGINPACTRMRSLIRVLSTVFDPSSGEQDMDVVNLLVEEGFKDVNQIRQDFPPGIALPILEVLYRCRNHLHLDCDTAWSPEAWSLVGRDDLRRNMTVSKLKDAAGGPSDGQDADPDDDGLVALERSGSILFPEDNRIREAARLLRSSRPIFLRVQRAVEVSDHDYERLKQKKLLVLSRRAVALSVGRGMLSFGSLCPVAAEPLPIPDLCLKGRVPPTNTSLALDDSDCPSDMRVWPEFHNGVAAGLRLPLLGESDVNITRTWIIYNRPPAANQPQAEGEDANPAQQRKSHTHGGLLLALGLRGHLTALQMSDIYDYLTQGSVTTTVGVLLGMAANKRGSGDMAVSKMLCLHIPSLIPQHFSAIDVASTVQAAAVIGAGLLFQGSSHRMMTEFLLNEIGKRPESDASAFDRESYTLSCGLALGMVNLCLGEKTGDSDRAAGIADLRVEERLYRYMAGGIDDDESRRRRETNDRFSLPSVATSGDNERCSTIYEGNLINTDVTAPGATLALGLMYMKTGNQTVASVLALPQTHFLLEFVRPDFLALRIISRALILWDSVEPTSEWIERQIPPVISKAYAEMRALAKKVMEGKSTAKNRLEHEYDRRAVRQIYVHLIAGSCFAMGLRYAGTGDQGAKAAITERVMELHKLREANDAVSAASRPEFPILDSCLSSAAMALAMVLAGSGDLDALRLFKILRWRCDEDSRYGHHMTFGMAIGLLFLGGGTCTLGRAPADLAMLVTAFFPRYPVSTSDNQYHLQALRHLYALAVKTSELRALDVETNEPVHLPIQIKSLPSNTTTLMVPCLLPNTDTDLLEIAVETKEYYPLRVTLRQDGRAHCFFVKKRRTPGHERSVQSLPQAGSAFLKAFGRYVNSDTLYQRRALEECIDEDVEEALALYLVRPSTANGYWDLRLLRTYYSERAGDTVQGLLDTQVLLPCLLETAERRLMETASIGNSLAFYD